MTRTYAARQLLRHGPLNFRQFHEITGWTAKQCGKTLWSLIGTGGIVHFCGLYATDLCEIDLIEAGPQRLVHFWMREVA